MVQTTIEPIQLAPCFVRFDACWSLAVLSLVRKVLQPAIRVIQVDLWRVDGLPLDMFITPTQSHQEDKVKRNEQDTHRYIILLQIYPH